MNFYRLSEQDKLAVAYIRCFQEAEDGRAALALARLGDLAKEFPADGDVTYSEALIRIQFLGQGVQGHQLCWTAYQQKPSIQEALFNSLKFCPDRQTFHMIKKELTPTARNEPGVCRLLEIEEDTENFVDHLIAIFSNHMSGDGEKAAMLELILKSGTDLPPDVYGKYLHARGILLRELDKAAEHKLLGHSEFFLPEDRLALAQALHLFEKNIKNPYFISPEVFNYCSAWCYLLHQYEKTIQYADLALESRPDGYALPYRNRAQALWSLGRKAEGDYWIQKALRQAEDGADAGQIRAIKDVMTNQERPLPEPKELMEGILAAAGDQAYSEITAGKSKLERIAELLENKLDMVGTQWSGMHVRLVSELLSMFSPEAAHFIWIRADQHRQKKGKPLAGSLILNAAVCLVGIGDGVIRRDAARLVLLGAMTSLDGNQMMKTYQEGIADIAATALAPLSDIHSICQMELKHYPLPEWISTQVPMTPERRARAQEKIDKYYSPIPSPPAEYPTVPSAMPVSPVLWAAIPIMILLAFYLGRWLHWW
jgi:tetratricopeptide (TPR) repeat protein